ARCTGIMLLSVIAHELGSLDRVTRIIKVSGFVNAVPEFSEHPKVINGCSDLLIEVFGERGRHAPLPLEFWPEHENSIIIIPLPGRLPVAVPGLWTLGDTEHYALCHDSY